MHKLSAPGAPYEATLGCARCGELQTSKSLRAGDACPHCKTGRLALLDGKKSDDAHGVMFAWMLRDAHQRTDGFGTGVGAVLGFAASLVITALVNVGTGA